MYYSSDDAVAISKRRSSSSRALQHLTKVQQSPPQPSHVMLPRVTHVSPVQLGMRDTRVATKAAPLTVAASPAPSAMPATAAKISTRMSLAGGTVTATIFSSGAAADRTRGADHHVLGFGGAGQKTRRRESVVNAPTTRRSIRRLEPIRVKIKKPPVVENTKTNTKDEKEHTAVKKMSKKRTSSHDNALMDGNEAKGAVSGFGFGPALWLHRFIYKAAAAGTRKRNVAGKKNVEAAEAEAVQQNQSVDKIHTNSQPTITNNSRERLGMHCFLQLSQFMYLYNTVHTTITVSSHVYG